MDTGHAGFFLPTMRIHWRNVLTLVDNGLKLFLYIHSKKHNRREPRQNTRRKSELVRRKRSKQRFTVRERATRTRYANVKISTKIKKNTKRIIHNMNHTRSTLLYNWLNDSCTEMVRVFNRFKTSIQIQAYIHAHLLCTITLLGRCTFLFHSSSLTVSWAIFFSICDCNRIIAFPSNEEESHIKKKEV